MSQKVHKEYIQILVNRYKKSTATFAWELGNKPRCHGCPTSTIYNWATETSEHIRTLDSDHMVTLVDGDSLSPVDGCGDGSYAYSAIEGVDFALNLQIKTLDYGVLHLYPNSWGYNYTWGNEVRLHSVTSWTKYLTGHSGSSSMMPSARRPMN